MNFITFTRLPHSRRYDLCMYYIFIMLRVSSELLAWATTGRTTVTLLYLLHFHSHTTVLAAVSQLHYCTCCIFTVTLLYLLQFHSHTIVLAAVSQSHYCTCCFFTVTLLYLLQFHSHTTVLAAVSHLHYCTFHAVQSVIEETLRILKHRYVALQI